MNDRNQLICDAMTKLMKISVEAKAKDNTDVFVRWAPHVSKLDAQICLNGWEKDKATESFDVHLNGTLKENQERFDIFYEQIILYIENADSMETEIKRLEAEADMFTEKACKTRDKCRKLRALAAEKEINEIEPDKILNASAGKDKQ